MNSWSDSLMSSFSEVLTNPIVVIILSAVILVLVLILVLSRPVPTVHAFTGPAGRVTVSRRAVHDLIEARCRAFRGVGSAKANVTNRGGELDVRIDLKVRESARLEDLSSQIQGEVGGMLRENLALENIGSIDIVVTGVSRSD
jgi:hypothetical protein